jgi:ApaG protein
MPKYQFTCETVTHYLADQSAPGDGIFGFAYTITITNTGDVPAQLISRMVPLLRPGESFEYSSGTRLRSASGTMRGNFFCVAEDGERFDADVPPFTLQADWGESPLGHTLH